MIKPYPQRMNLDSGALTDVQTKILQRLVEDAPVEEIARQLNLAPSEVKLHRENIMRELKVSNIGGLTRHAVRHGLIR